MWMLYVIYLLAKWFAIACVIVGALLLAGFALAGVLMIVASIWSAIFLRRRRWWHP